MRPFENSKRGGPAERSPVSFAGIAALWAVGVIYLFRASWFSSLGNVSRPLRLDGIGCIEPFCARAARTHGYFEERLWRCLINRHRGPLVRKHAQRIESVHHVFFHSADLDATGSARSAAVEHGRSESGCCCFTSASLLLRWGGRVRCRSKKARPLSLILSLRSGPRRESAPVCLNCTRTN